MLKLPGVFCCGAFETVAAIMGALGVTFSIEAQRAKTPRKLRAA
jgi:hypothetical protein